jgi:hypothetical protein
MRWAVHVASMETMTCREFFSENIPFTGKKGRKHLGDEDIEGTTILEWMLRSRVWIG